MQDTPSTAVQHLLQPLVLQQGICKDCQRQKKIKKLTFAVNILISLFKIILRSSSPTLSGQVKIAFVCLMAVKHLQCVFAFVILGRVQDFNPDLLHGAASLRPDILVNPLIPTQQEGTDTFTVSAAATCSLERDLWKPSLSC